MWAPGSERLGRLRRLPTRSPPSAAFSGEGQADHLSLPTAGPSQVDTFDPKPCLDKYQRQAGFRRAIGTKRKTGNLLKSPFKFERVRAEWHRSQRAFSRASAA